MLLMRKKREKKTLKYCLVSTKSSISISNSCKLWTNNLENKTDINLNEPKREKWINISIISKSAMQWSDCIHFSQTVLSMCWISVRTLAFYSNNLRSPFLPNITACSSITLFDCSTQDVYKWAWVAPWWLFSHRFPHWMYCSTF